MDLRKAIEWAPPAEWRRMTVIDSHAAGEPFRVVLEGAPEIPGTTVLARRRYAEAELDQLRKTLMWEPRGHADMYGALVGPPVLDNSDVSVLFLHNEGFSTMCGHGIIALTKVLVDTGIIPGVEPETGVTIDTPAGQIAARAQVRDGLVRSVRFRNVASYVVELDAGVEVPGLGPVSYDLAFGGAFYAYVSAEDVGVDLSNAGDLISAARRIKASVIESRDLTHPFEPDLGFLYGVIFVGEPVDPANHSRNVCVFADGEIDRSPTGTGVSGRLAILHARGALEVGQPITVESIIGSTFDGLVSELVEYGGHDAVIPEIIGTAHITGRTEFWMDPDDKLGNGFFLR